MKFGSKRRLKPIISAAFSRPHDVEAAPDPLDRQVDRLFAEDRLSGPRRLFDHVGVQVGRRGDQDRVDVLGVQDCVDRTDLGAVAPGDRLGGLGKRVRDRNELCAGGGGDGAGVNLADAAGAQKPESQRHRLSLHPAFRRARPLLSKQTVAVSPPLGLLRRSEQDPFWNLYSIFLDRQQIRFAIVRISARLFSHPPVPKCGPQEKHR